MQLGLDFLMGRPKVVKVDNKNSTTLILNTKVPQELVLSPLLYSLFNNDCMATHVSNSIIKFADDTTAVGLITNNDETAYREEVRTLAEWCQENNLFLNKMKEPIMDFRRQREHTPSTSKSFKFLGVHITESEMVHPTDSVVKAQ